MAIDGAFDVVVVGSANLDLVARTPRLPRPGETVTGSQYFESCGGKGANQAIAASRAGARTAFIGAIGKDHAGETLRAAFTSNNVDTTALQTVEVSTGRALIGVSDDGENSIIVVPGANHAITVGEIQQNARTISSARVLLCQLEVPIEVVQTAFSLAGTDTIRILNPAPAVPLTSELLALVDVIIPNEHELKLLGGEDALLKHGIKTIIVTQGAQGATLITQDAQTKIQPYVVVPVDSTGAGDAFCAMIAARLAIGEPMAEALKAAVVSGALTTLVAGAVPSLPIWSMVSSKLESM
jgi:ribokinase